MNITINGTAYEVAGNSITHEQVTDLAGQPISASVTYTGPRRGDAQRSGIMSPGKTIELEDGMDFTAVRTGNA